MSSFARLKRLFLEGGGYDVLFYYFRIKINGLKASNFLFLNLFLLDRIALKFDVASFGR